LASTRSEGSEESCLSYPSAALPPIGELVGWPDESAEIRIARADGTIMLGDQRGRLMGWLSGSDKHPVIYSTRGALVSITRYGAFYSLSGRVLQRTETTTGTVGYDVGGRVPTNDTIVAWGDDIGRYVGAWRKFNGEASRSSLMVLDDCVVAERRSSTPNTKDGPSCSQGAIGGGVPGNLPGSRAISLSSRTIVTGWIGADSLVTLEEQVGAEKEPRRLVVRDLSSLKTRAESEAADGDEILVAGMNVIRWDSEAHVLKKSSLTRPKDATVRFSEPSAREACWKLVGSSLHSAILRCGTVGGSRWKVIDLGNGRVIWSADDRVGGVTVDAGDTIWVARAEGVCTVNGTWKK
jgi:hypothetical protein